MGYKPKAIGYAAMAKVENALDFNARIRRALKQVNDLTGLPAEVYRLNSIALDNVNESTNELRDLLMSRVEAKDEQL